MSLPSEALPDRIPKKVSPLGGFTPANAAYTAPVSEFESPKLYIAGYQHFLFTPYTSINTRASQSPR
ncbi:hypothetical protein Lal_00028050 [Lupinus albus]|nr:hypothetical protein Lal_00028050 [Lupinus albus]